jgi:hypothetical protein
VKMHDQRYLLGFCLGFRGGKIVLPSCGFVVSAEGVGRGVLSQKQQGCSQQESWQQCTEERAAGCFVNRSRALFFSQTTFSPHFLLLCQPCKNCLPARPSCCVGLARFRAAVSDAPIALLAQATYGVPGWDKQVNEPATVKSNFSIYLF